MIKRIINSLIMFSLLILLAACNNKEETIQLDKSKILSIANEAIEEATPNEYEVFLVEEAKLTNELEEIPELVVIYKSNFPYNDHLYMKLVRVFQYNPDENNWEIVLKQSVESEHDIEIYETLNLKQNEEEQLLLGYIQNSSGDRSYSIIGSLDSKVATLFDQFQTEDKFSNSTYKLIDGRTIAFTSSDIIVEAFQWAKDDFISVDTEEMAEENYSKTKENEDIILIPYSINENGMIESEYANGSTIHAEIGQYVEFIRLDTDESQTVRIMISANDSSKLDYETGEILGRDIFTYSLLPNDDWELEYIIYVDSN